MPIRRKRKKRAKGPPPKTWKHKEARTAKFFRTHRRALSGGNSNHENQRDDAHHPRLYIECKLATSQPLWRLWESCEINTRKERVRPKRRPILSIYEYGHAESLFAFHESDALCFAAEVLLARLPCDCSRLGITEWLKEVSNMRLVFKPE